MPNANQTNVARMNDAISAALVRDRLDRDIDAWTRDQTQATDPNAPQAYARLLAALLQFETLIGQLANPEYVEVPDRTRRESDS